MNTLLESQTEFLKQMRFNKEEIQTLKSALSSRWELLKVLRKHFLQIPLSKEEEIDLKMISTKPLQALYRKFFLPEVNGDEPLSQAFDLYKTLPLEQVDLEKGGALISARAILIEYIEQQLESLNGGDEKLRRNSLVKDDEYVKVLAHIDIIKHVEQQLSQIFILAGAKEETAEETLERLKKNSSK